MAKAGKGDEAKDKGGKGGDNKITLTVVVNGQPFEVTANVNQPLHTIVPEALKLSGNVGQGPEAWDLKDAGGTVLDGSQKIETFGFGKETKLFLSLKAGVAGA